MNIIYWVINKIEIAIVEEVFYNSETQKIVINPINNNLKELLNDKLMNHISILIGCII